MDRLADFSARIKQVTLMFAKGWFARQACMALLVAALLFVVGCGKGGTYATVAGTVTHNGSPVDGAKVTFWSTVEGGGKQAGSFSATTDSSGKYLIASFNKDPGIPPGMYKVTIQKLDMKGGNLPKDFDPGQMEASGAGVNMLPKDYESPKSTKFSVTLAEGKNEGKDFELKGTATKGGKAVGTP